MLLRVECTVLVIPCTLVQHQGLLASPVGESNFGAIWKVLDAQVPGDGRELVVALPNAVTVRAEDGRRVEATDISPFISNLPFGGPLLPYHAFGFFLLHNERASQSSEGELDQV